MRFIRPAQRLILTMTDSTVEVRTGRRAPLLLTLDGEERDFDLVDPIFFSTSQAGIAAPAVGKPAPPVKDAHDVAALMGSDTLISCQGGDYTAEMYPRLRAAGWTGYWIDAASTLRMKDHAVIVLDPVNRDVIDAALDTVH